MTREETWEDVLTRWGPAGVRLEWHGTFAACRTERNRLKNWEKCWFALSVMSNPDMGVFAFDPNMTYSDFIRKGGIVTFFSY